MFCVDALVLMPVPTLCWALRWCWPDSSSVDRVGHLFKPFRAESLEEQKEVIINVDFILKIQAMKITSESYLPLPGAWISLVLLGIHLRFPLPVAIKCQGLIRFYR